jgi:hypothetical protein
MRPLISKSTKPAQQDARADALTAPLALTLAEEDKHGLDEGMLSR